MAKDFDSERHAKRASEDDRTFTLGGQVFVAKATIHPSVLIAYDKITPETGVGETLDVIDEVITNMLEDRDDARRRYYDVRADTDDPVTVDDLLELVKWLMEAQTGRPTGPPSGSASGPTTIVTPSTGVSSSPATRPASPASA